MNKLEKFLQRLSNSERSTVEKIFEKIIVGDTTGLDIKKLTGYPNFYRVRKGRIRILYEKRGQAVTIIATEFRDGGTYKL